MNTLELWSGVECTVVRLGDEYRDQTRETGHHDRLDDIDRIAGLGVTAVRYPVLWERVAPSGLASADWRWTDERLERLRAHGVRPIAGLVHHGSGPASTSLVEDSFVDGLRDYARAVAERYPWLRDYTPLNEPLTTARFSALYGHWYPHHRDYRSFWRALSIECRAIIEAMRAIREINPRARLVQTEDMGHTWSTPALAAQATFENERRWLSLDLLCGRVDATHPLWSALQSWGCSEAEAEWFRVNACPPDVVGLNYYMTSDRFLDERQEHYPAWSHGGNGSQSYADIEAVRVFGPGILGHRAVLERVWRRYGLPVAITEAHLHCGREDQLRWLDECWRAARGLRNEGVPVEAVTVWSTFGAVDWRSLLRARDGFYEPGAFDVRGSEPRATAVAHMAQALAHGDGEAVDHPILTAPGWWRLRERFAYPVFGAIAADDRQTPTQPLLILRSASGWLATALARACAARGIVYRLLGGDEVDVGSPLSVAQLLDDLRPWALVNAAGYGRVDTAELEVDRCLRENTRGPMVLAAACARRGVPMTTFSSDLVFGGEQRSAYVESDRPTPLSVYGMSKAEAEREVTRLAPSALVIRTSAFFGSSGADDFVTRGLAALARGEVVRVADDHIVSPTYLPDLVDAVLDLVIDGARGVWHLANRAALSWAQLAAEVATAVGFDPSAIEPCPRRTLGQRAMRPDYSVLGSERGGALPPLSDALVRYAAQVRRRYPNARAVAGGEPCVSS